MQKKRCTPISHLPSGEEADFWEKTAFTLLFLLISLFTDRLDWIFRCIFWETGAEVLWLSVGACLAPWWIPFPLLRLMWPPFLILPSSSSCVDVCSWGRRWGWAEFKKKNHLVKQENVLFYSSEKIYSKIETADQTHANKTEKTWVGSGKRRGRRKRWKGEKRSVLEGRKV